MSYRIEYVSPDGGLRLESGVGDGPAFIEGESLEGFVGEFEDTGVSVVGAPGEVVDFRDRRVLPLTGSFTLVVKDTDRWGEVRSAFSSRMWGQLVIEGEQRFVLPVRLSASLPSPASKPVVGSRVQVSLRADGGVWLCPLFSRDSDVIVTNWGDVPVWPRVVWDGKGGRVTLPSGVGFDLPAVKGEHVLHLDRVKAGEVFGPDGFDAGLTRRVDAVSEMVPIGEERTFKVPAGARLLWDVGVFDPWR